MCQKILQTRGGSILDNVPDKSAARSSPGTTEDGETEKDRYLIIYINCAKAINYISKTIRERLFPSWYEKPENMTRTQMLQMYSVQTTEKHTLTLLPAKERGTEFLKVIQND